MLPSFDIFRHPRLPKLSRDPPDIVSRFPGPVSETNLELARGSSNFGSTCNGSEFFLQSRQFAVNSPYNLDFFQELKLNSIVVAVNNGQPNKSEQVK